MSENDNEAVHMSLIIEGELPPEAQALGVSVAQLDTCAAALLVAHSIARLSPPALILRGGLAAQLHIKDSGRQRLSSDVDFYFEGPELDAEALVDSISTALDACEWIDCVTRRASGSFPIQIPMVSLDVHFSNQCPWIRSGVDSVKVDVALLPYHVDSVALELRVLTLSLDSSIQVVSAEHTLAEKLVKFAADEVSFPSRELPSLTKQVYDIFQILDSRAWTEDSSRVGGHLFSMLPRESVYRGRTLLHHELLRMIRSGGINWLNYVGSQRSWQSLQDFQNRYIGLSCQVPQSEWLLRSQAVFDLIDIICHDS